MARVSDNRMEFILLEVAAYRYIGSAYRDQVFNEKTPSKDKAISAALAFL